VQNFSERLTAIWRESKISKGVIADQLGVALSTVSRWFGGKVPSSHHLHGLADLLGVDAQWLLHGGQEKTPNRIMEPDSTVTPRFNEPPSIYGNPPDFRQVLEDVILLSEPSAVQDMLQSMVKEFESGDMRRAGRFSILTDTIRRVRPGLLTIRAPVSYLDRPDDKPEPEPEPEP